MNKNIKTQTEFTTGYDTRYVPEKYTINSRTSTAAGIVMMCLLVAVLIVAAVVLM